MSKKIVGIDPGVTTGLCVFYMGKMMDGREAMSVEEVIKYIEDNEPDLVVMEDYIIGRRPSRSKEPIKVIGVVEYVCRKMGLEVVLQSPSILKLMMRRVDDFHRSDHVRSACAHVTYYIESRLCR